MKPADALFVLLEQDDMDFIQAYLDKYGIDEVAFSNLLHLQGEINTLVSAVEKEREGY